MKKLTARWAIGVLMLCVVLSARATSVTVEVTLEQDQFLSGEDLRAAVRITNLSGQTLQLGREEGWVTFFVESLDNFIVSRNGAPPVAGEFSLENSLTATKRVNLTPYFNIQRPGRYRLVARVKIPQWNLEVTSNPRFFDVISGTRLHVLEFGMPAAEADSGLPEVRKYVLQQANYNKDMRLYLRVTDASESKVYKMFPLARMLSFSRVEAQLDRFSNIHVLHQTGQRGFTYHVVNPDGQIVLRQTHDIVGDSRPRLRTIEGGRISVMGGVRRETLDDLPPRSIDEASPSESDAKPPSP